jgi:hypothetical protein
MTAIPDMGSGRRAWTANRMGAGIETALAESEALPLHFASDEYLHLQPTGELAQGFKPAQFHDGHDPAAPKSGGWHLRFWLT